MLNPADKSLPKVPSTYTLQFMYSEEVFRELCRINGVTMKQHQSEDTSKHKGTTKKTIKPHSTVRQVQIERIAEINSELCAFPGHRRQVLAGELAKQKQGVDLLDPAVLFRGIRSRAPSPRPFRPHPFVFSAYCSRWRRNTVTLPSIREEVTSLSSVKWARAASLTSLRSSSAASI